MMRAKPFLLSILLLVWLCPGVAGAQPTVHGSLSGTLGPGDYIVDGDCWVDAGNSLTIQPGTTLLFSGHYTFDIYGMLTAVGTEQDSINFIRQFPTEACKHGGIRFHNGSSPNSILSYCWIDYAKNYSSPNYSGGAIYVQNVGITISNCTISNGYASTGGGIYATGSPLTINECIFFRNSAGNGGGLYLYSSSGAQVSNSIFAKNASTST